MTSAAQVTTFLKLGDAVTVWFPYPSGLTNALGPSHSYNSGDACPLVPPEKCLSEFTIVDSASQTEHHCHVKFLRVQGILLEVRELMGSHSSIASEVMFQFARPHGKSFVAYVRFKEENDNRNGSWVPLSLVTSKSSSQVVPPAIVSLCEAAAGHTSSKECALPISLPVDDGQKKKVAAPLHPIRAPSAILSRVPYEPVISPELGQMYVEKKKDDWTTDGGTIALKVPLSLPTNISNKNPPTVALATTAGMVSQTNVHPLFAATANYMKQCVDSRDEEVKFLESRLSRDFRSPPSQCRYFLYLVVESNNPSPDDADAKIDLNAPNLPPTFVDGYAFPPWYYSPVHMIYGGPCQMGPLDPSDGVAEASIKSVLANATCVSMNESPTEKGVIGQAADNNIKSTKNNNVPCNTIDLHSFVLGSVPPSRVRPSGKRGLSETAEDETQFGSEIDSSEFKSRSNSDLINVSGTFSDSDSLVSAAVGGSLAAHRNQLQDLHLCPFSLRLTNCIRQHHADIDKLMDLRLLRVMSISNSKVMVSRNIPSATKGPPLQDNGLKTAPTGSYPLGPPGDEIYCDMNRGVSVYFLIGNDHRPYVRNLFLLTKSFLENKLVGHDVSLYNVYCVCLHTRVHFPLYHVYLIDRAEAAILRRRKQQQGTDSNNSDAVKSSASTRRLAEIMVSNSCAFGGFYSTEKGGTALGYNLACIMSLPCFGWDGANKDEHKNGHNEADTLASVNTPSRQATVSSPGKGLGSFIIRLSYEVAYRKGHIGTPERPLSDLGAKAYQSYWRALMLTWMQKVSESTKHGDVSCLSELLGSAFSAPRLGQPSGSSVEAAMSAKGGANRINEKSTTRKKKSVAKKRARSTSSQRSSTAGSSMTESSESEQSDDDVVEIPPPNRAVDQSKHHTEQQESAITTTNGREQKRSRFEPASGTTVIDLTVHDDNECLTKYPSSTRRLISRGLGKEPEDQYISQQPQSVTSETLKPLLRTSAEAIGAWAGLTGKDTLAALGEMGVFHTTASEGTGGYSLSRSSAPPVLTLMIPADMVEVPVKVRRTKPTAHSGEPPMVNNSGAPLVFDPHCFLF